MQTKAARVAGREDGGLRPLGTAAGSLFRGELEAACSWTEALGRQTENLEQIGNTPEGAEATRRLQPTRERAEETVAQSRRGPEGVQKTETASPIMKRMCVSCSLTRTYEHGVWL